MMQRTLCNDVFTSFNFSLLRKGNGIKLQTKKSKSSSTKVAKDQKKKKTDSHKSKSVDEKKFELYFDFDNFIDNIQSHQVLAINRAENLKVIITERIFWFDNSLKFSQIISVKILIPSKVQFEIRRFIEKKYFSTGKMSKEREKIMKNSLDEAITKKCVFETKIKLRFRSIKYFYFSVSANLSANPFEANERCWKRIDWSVWEKSEAIIAVASSEGQKDSGNWSRIQEWL